MCCFKPGVEQGVIAIIKSIDSRKRSRELEGSSSEHIL